MHFEASAPGDLAHRGELEEGQEPHSMLASGSLVHRVQIPFASLRDVLLKSSKSLEVEK